MNATYTPDPRDKKLFAFVLNTAQKHWKDCQVFLFGSRARGDNKPMSDYDIAVVTPNVPHHEWAVFELEIKENAPTLLPIDLVWMNHIDESFKSRILQEGIPLTKILH